MTNLEILQRAAGDEEGDALLVDWVAGVCLQLGVDGLHARLTDQGWTVIAVVGNRVFPGSRRFESTRSTLRQALACALLPHLEEMS